MFLFAVFCILLNIFVWSGVEGSCHGCVELDELTFDKLVKRFPATLVKFDIAYPYGDKHEAFASFASSVADGVHDLLVALVGIKDYGEKDNAVLGKRFSVKEAYPDIKLFTSNLTWVNYPTDTEISVENLKQFVRDHSSIYIGLPGCIKQFDELVNDLIKHFDHDKLTKTIDQVKHLAQQLQDENEQSAATVYITVLKKIYEKGLDFVQAERQRVKQLLTGKITDVKRKELNVRLNIMKAFDGNASAGTVDKSEL